MLSGVGGKLSFSERDWEISPCQPTEAITQRTNLHASLFSRQMVQDLHLFFHQVSEMPPKKKKKTLRFHNLILVAETDYQDTKPGLAFSLELAPS